MAQNDIAISVQRLKKSDHYFSVLKGIDFQVKSDGLLVLMYSGHTGRITIINILNCFLIIKSPR